MTDEQVAMHKALHKRVDELSIDVDRFRKEIDRVSERAERADLEKVASREAVAGGDGALSGDVEHSVFADEFVLRLTMAASENSGKPRVRWMRGSLPVLF